MASFQLARVPASMAPGAENGVGSVVGVPKSSLAAAGLQTAKNKAPSAKMLTMLHTAGDQCT